ncbi:unnamed protein product [Oppiella nova]|uniref:Uncharacterized protein n=1 Tax=Oppiella nova TaxID=334625 RepID=A0A7R9M8M0_9ACAR|nr:unnamed protein product [Oppiella nova]CAG2171521.1 unnamed protein product [Oppiella nova]
MSFYSVEKFRIFSDIDTTIKRSVKLFYVFNAGKNALFVTNDDLVYGLGDNTGGCLGLGHRDPSPTPTRILNLCHKRVNQFTSFSGFTHIIVFAITADSHVYSWGTVHPDNCISLVPQEISNLNNKNITQICCGSERILALTTDGQVYELTGYKDDDHRVRYQIAKVGSKSVIKSIYCGSKCSCAVTTEGQVLGREYASLEKNKLLREVQTLQTAESEYVVKYYNSWDEGKYFYIQMEYIESDNIEKFVVNCSQTKVT